MNSPLDDLPIEDIVAGDKVILIALLCADRYWCLSTTVVGFVDKVRNSLSSRVPALLSCDRCLVLIVASTQHNWHNGGLLIAWCICWSSMPCIKSVDLLATTFLPWILWSQILGAEFSYTTIIHFLAQYIGQSGDPPAVIRCSRTSVQRGQAPISCMSGASCVFFRFVRGAEV